MARVRFRIDPDGSWFVTQFSKRLHPVICPRSFSSVWKMISSYRYRWRRNRIRWAGRSRRRNWRARAFRIQHRNFRV